MRVEDIKNKINSLVETRDKKYVEAKTARIHLWCRGRMLCSSRPNNPYTTVDVNEVDCKWCLKRIEKRFNE